MMRGQSFNSNFSKIIQNSSPNEEKVIETKHSLGKANLSSCIITPEGQNILSLMMLLVCELVIKTSCICSGI